MRDTLIPLLSTRCDKAMVRDAATTRGHLAYLMARHHAYREYPLAVMTDWLEVPIALDQVQVFFDAATHAPVGYVTWALLSDDVERRWLNDPSTLLHCSEWNEGDRLWIMDFVAPFGHASDIARHLRRHGFAGHDRARSVRRDADGNVARICTWGRARARTGPDRADG
jgi:cytolysin-activating lysine-acyltransferase